MTLICKEFIIPKQELIRQTFEQTFEKNLQRMLNQELIREMFDAGCFKIERIQCYDSDRILLKISIAVEKPQ